MDSSKQKNRKILEIVFLISLVIGIFYLAYKLYNSFYTFNDLIIENNNLKNVLNEKEETLNNVNIKYQEIKETADKLISIEQEYQNNKDLFFDNILKLENMILYDETDAKIAYLTIDDGPNTYTTYNWIDILNKHDVLATFFVNEKDYLDDQYKVIIDNCHVLANHTSSHDIFGENGVYSGVENFRKNIIENHDFIKNRYDIEMNIFRFPGGSNETKYLNQDKQEYVNALYDLSYGYVDWNVSSGDGNRKHTANEYLNYVLQNANGKRIITVLMHDDSLNTINALDNIINALENRGYILLPLQYDSYMVNKNND